MGSKKRSAWAKQKADFRDNLRESGQFDDLFAAEDRRRDAAAERRAAELREKACESKNRYVSLADAEEAIAACAAHGTRGLHAYRCPYCNGWHLTSKSKPA